MPKTKKFKRIKIQYSAIKLLTTFFYVVMAMLFILSPAYEVKAQSSNEYILPFSHARTLTDSDLLYLTREELRLARNEIYARHGRRFRDEGLQAYFDAQVWYTPTLPLGTEPVLTALEIANAEFILNFESRVDAGLIQLRPRPVQAPAPSPIPTSPSHIHILGNWSTTREATCTVAGHRERRCTECNDVVESETIPALGHALSGVWIIRREPTCAEEGYQVQYCTRIDEPVLTEAIPALPHTPIEEWIIVTEPTCTTVGEKVMYCEVCEGVAESLVIPMLPHTPSGDWIVSEEPNCNTPGQHVQYCLISNSIALTESIPPITGLDHVFIRKRTRGNIFIPPITTEYVCEICNYQGVTSVSYAFIWVSPTIIAAIAVVAFFTFKQIKRGKKLVCPYCVRECYSGVVKTKNLQCPSCDSIIPSAIIQTENLPFSIIGVAGSGKSAYITVMLHELKKSAGLNLSLSHLDKDTLAHQNTNYKSLYEDRIPVPATAGGDPMPQVWSIKKLSKKSNSKNKVDTYTFTIFDGAGEHTQMIDVDSAVARYINMSEAIIFVLDPLTISSVRKAGLVDEDVMNKSLGGGGGEISFAEDVVNDIANYIRAMNPKKYGTNTTIEIPVAVVLTKFDTVWNHPSFGENALVKNPSLTILNGNIKSEEIEEVHSEVEDWLEAIEEHGLLMSLKVNFPNHKFFGVSSYGEPPKDVSALNMPNPHRVLDPILWLFKNKKFID